MVPALLLSVVHQDGVELLLDKEVVGAIEKVEVPLTLLTVDHGMLDEPGGFAPASEAVRVANVNSNID